jgi:hypothetical protein
MRVVIFVENKAYFPAIFVGRNFCIIVGKFNAESHLTH